MVINNNQGSQAYLFYKLSQTQLINLSKLRRVFQYKTNKPGKDDYFVKEGLLFHWHLFWISIILETKKILFSYIKQIDVTRAGPISLIVKNNYFRLFKRISCSSIKYSAFFWILRFKYFQETRLEGLYA